MAPVHLAASHDERVKHVHDPAGQEETILASSRHITELNVKVCHLLPPPFANHPACLVWPMSHDDYALLLHSDRHVAHRH